MSKTLSSSIAWVYAAIVSWIATAGGANSLAQEKPAEGEKGFPVATLNVEKIAQTYRPFVAKVAELQAELKELQDSASLKQSELQTVGNDLQKAEPNSAEAKKLQGQYVKLNQELQAFVQQGQQQIQRKDWNNTLALHREIEVVLKPYCKEKGIRLVVRTANVSLDENQNPQQIVQALSRSVIFEEGIDITGDVLKLLEKGSAEKEGE